MLVQKLWKNPFLKFLITACSLYIVWYLLYHGFINEHTSLDRKVIDNLIALSGGMLEFLGYTLIPEPPAIEQIRTVGIDGTFGLWIGDPCNGLSLFALFSIFILCYPGPWRSKLWFIPFGLLSIHLINVLRIVALCIIVSYDYAYLDFNHNYTFTILVNGYMFLLWLWWARSYGPRLKSLSNENK